MRKLFLVCYIVGNLTCALSFMNVITHHKYSEWRGMMHRMTRGNPQQESIDVWLVQENMEQLNKKLVDQYVFLFFPWMVCFLSSCIAVFGYRGHIRAVGVNPGSRGEPRDKGLSQS